MKNTIWRPSSTDGISDPSHIQHISYGVDNTINNHQTNVRTDPINLDPYFFISTITDLNKQIVRLDTEAKYESGNRERIITLESEIKHLRKELTEIKENKKFTTTYWLSITSIIVCLLSVLLSAYATFRTDEKTPIATTQSSVSPEKPQ